MQKSLLFGKIPELNLEYSGLKNIEEYEKITDEALLFLNNTMSNYDNSSHDNQGHFHQQYWHSIIIENFSMVATGIREVSLYYPGSLDEIYFMYEMAKRFSTGFRIFPVSPNGFKIFTFGKLSKRNKELVEFYRCGIFADPDNAASPEALLMTGIALNYPECCIKQFLEDALLEIRPEERYFQQIKQLKDGLSDNYYVDSDNIIYELPFHEFVPCKPGCKNALLLGKSIENKLKTVSKSIHRHYIKSLEINRIFLESRVT